MKSTELERLRASSDDFESGPTYSDDTLYARFQVDCNGQSSEILSLAKKVLVTVIENVNLIPPESDVWDQILPQRFVARCGRHPSAEERERSMTRPIEERLAEQNSVRWSRQMFINAFVPELELRNWRWWHGIVVSDTQLQVIVSVDGDLVAWQSFRWLFIGSGATDVKILPIS